MPTLDDLSVPVFSYVGRLKDSRKGLELFLDALEQLWKSHFVHRFKAWVIGGSEEDKVWAIRLATCRPILKEMLSSGDLIFWGRIENSALPEFYSRSTALIVPSFREQFGITAVEAMMCGCPVVAARVGGLQDIVVNGRTGDLFDRGVASSLVGIMATYIATPSLPRWLGANAAVWARRSFAASIVFDAIARVLKDPCRAECADWLASAETAFRSQIIGDAIPRVESLLASDIDSFEDLTSGPSISFMAHLKNQTRAFVKIYTDRPTDLSTLYAAPFSDSDCLIPKERLAVALKLQGQRFFPSVLAHDLDSGLIVQEWARPELISNDQVMGIMRAAISLLQACDPAPQLSPVRASIREKLAEHNAVSFGLLEEIDRLTAELHAPLVGGSLRVRRLHPQLEILRLSDVIDRNAFWLPRDYVARAQAVISFLLAAEPLIPSPPVFAHGSLKAAHLLNPQPLLCDFDHAGYYCGPIDVAHWIWEYYSVHGGHPGSMFEQLREELDDSKERYLGACWILAFRLTQDFIKLSRGNSSPARETLPFLYELTEAFRRISPTR